MKKKITRKEPIESYDGDRFDDILELRRWIEIFGYVIHEQEIWLRVQKLARANIDRLVKKLQLK